MTWHFTDLNSIGHVWGHLKMIPEPLKIEKSKELLTESLNFYARRCHQVWCQTFWIDSLGEDGLHCCSVGFTRVEKT